MRDVIRMVDGSVVVCDPIRNMPMEQWPEAMLEIHHRMARTIGGRGVEFMVVMEYFDLSGPARPTVIFPDKIVSIYTNS